MVPNRPGSALIVEDTEHCERLWVDRDVVQADIAVDQHAIGVANRELVVAVEQRVDVARKPSLGGDARNALADPCARFRKQGPARQPCGSVCCRNARVLLNQDLTELAAETCRQGGIRLRAFEERPRLAPTGHGRTHVERAVPGDEENARCTKRTACLDEPKHTSLCLENARALRSLREPREAIAG